MSDLDCEQLLDNDEEYIGIEIFDSEEEPEIIEHEDDIVMVENTELELHSVENEASSVNEDSIYYRAKAHINWNKVSYKPSRCRNENVIRKKPELNQYSSNIFSEQDEFRLLLTDERVNYILLHKNNRAKQIKNIILVFKF